MKSIMALGLALTLVAGYFVVGGTHSQSDELFENFITEYRRSYFSKGEYNLRRANFMNTLNLIEERNAQDTATHGITQFADWS